MSADWTPGFGVLLFQPNGCPGGAFCGKFLLLGLLIVGLGAAACAGLGRTGGLFCRPA